MYKLLKTSTNFKIHNNVLMYHHTMYYSPNFEVGLRENRWRLSIIFIGSCWSLDCTIKLYLLKFQTKNCEISKSQVATSTLCHWLSWPIFLFVVWEKKIEADSNQPLINTSIRINRRSRLRIYFVGDTSFDKQRFVTVWQNWTLSGWAVDFRGKAFPPVP